MTFPLPRLLAPTFCLALAGTAVAQPAFDVITTGLELEAAGLGGDGAAPIQAQLLGGNLVFATGFGAGSQVVRASGPGFTTLTTEFLAGTTTNPVTGDPFGGLLDFTATGGGVGAIALSKPFNELGPDDLGVFLRAEPGGSLRTLATLGDLPGLPRALVGGEGGLLGFALRGTDDANGVYLLNEATGTQILLAGEGAPILNAPGVTADGYQLSDGSLDGRTFTAIADGSDFERRLVTVTLGSVVSLLSGRDDLTDADGVSYDVDFVQAAVRDDGRTVARVIVNDAARARRDAIVSFDAAGNPTVLAVASADGSAGASIVDVGNNGGNLTTDGLLTVFVVNEEETSDAFLYDGFTTTRLFGSGDAFLDGELSVVDLSGEALDGDRLVFTAIYNDANGDQRTALATFLVPEPGSLAATLVLGLGLLHRRRGA